MAQGNKSFQLHYDFSNHLRSVAVINPHLHKHMTIPETYRCYSKEKKFNKYYGKKMTKLVCFYQKPSFNPASHCKALKSLAIYASLIPKYPSKHITHLDLSLACPYRLEDTSEAKKSKIRYNMASILRRISEFKDLISLNVTSGTELHSLERIRTLRNLKSVTLSLDRNELLENKEAILNLSSIESLCLSVGKHTARLLAENEESELYKIYKELLNSKRLRNLRLYINDCKDIRDQNVLKTFLEDIDQTNIPAFYIQMIYLKPSQMDIKSLKLTLNKVDLLTFYLDFAGEVYFSCDTENNVAQKAQRKLDITILAGQHFFSEHHWTTTGADDFEEFAKIQQSMKLRDNSQPFDLAESIANFAEDFVEIPLPLLNQGIRLRSLKSLSFDLRNDSSSKSIICEFTALIKNSGSLEHLGIQGFESPSLWYAQERYESLFHEISALKNLKSIEISGEIQSLQCEAHLAIEHLFKFIKNVPKVELRAIVCQIPNFLVCLLTSGSLKELYVDLPSLDPNDKEEVIKAILSLKELEKLEINKGNQLLQDEQNRRKLMVGLQSLKKLQEVSMPNYETFFASVEIIKEGLKLIAKEVEMYTKELFILNKSIEGFFVKIDNSCEIKYSRY